MAPSGIIAASPGGPNAAIYAAAGQQDRSRQPPAATGETGSARLKERANADGVEVDLLAVYFWVTQSQVD
jgi:hypothetical protein